MTKLLLSKKGQNLLKLYPQMVAGGYVNEITEVDIKDQFADFSSRYYKKQIKEISLSIKLNQFSITDVGDLIG